MAQVQAGTNERTNKASQQLVGVLSLSETAYRFGDETPANKRPSVAYLSGILRPHELSAENLYNFPLARFVVEFPLLDSFPKDNLRVLPGNYPEYSDWNDYRTPLIEAGNIVFQLTEQYPGLTGMTLFDKVTENLRTNEKYQGKTSHLLLSLFNKGYFGADSGQDLHLQQEIWDADDGHHINPPFKKEQTELPPNLQIRKTILSALSTDKTYHEAATTGDLTLHQKCAKWFKIVLDRMSEYTEIKQSGIPLT